MTQLGVLVFDPLDSVLRRGLEGVVVEARGLVESGVGRVFERLGVRVDPVSGVDRVSKGVPDHLSDSERMLRGVVLAKRRQLGSVGAVVEEVGFGVWHRMLFARFLAENGLLMHPELGVSVSLVECRELAAEEGQGDGWMVASRFASEMLPGLFPQNDPLARLSLLPEDLRALEELLEGLSVEVFTSDDGLGWVYQFWQSQRKDEVNASEVKIGARELPAVTQLFTEDYMVRFLLENSLGAWWAARHPDSPLVGSFDYLRFADDGEPAAGSFEGWPETVAEVTVMDPCCGSGHFLTAAFEMLWRMRAEEESLEPAAVQDAVLRDNLFGLELDPRCTQIAAFNLVLTAWKAGGYRELPTPNVACSGIRVAGSLDDWLKLAGDDARLRDGLEALHAQFKDADTLGSLINPRRASEVDTLMGVDFDQLEPLLHKALAKETVDDPAAAVFGRQAAGVAQAATLLSRQYTLITTNPPFLTIGRMSAVLREFVSRVSSDAKNELAAVLLTRVLNDSASNVSMVLPDNWLQTTRYEAMRRLLLGSCHLSLVSWLGSRAFETDAIGSRVRVVLMVAGAALPGPEGLMGVLDASASTEPEETARWLKDVPVRFLAQKSQLDNPDARILTVPLRRSDLLSNYAQSRYGLRTGDAPRLIRKFWEVDREETRWVLHQSTVSQTITYGGRTDVLDWNEGRGDLAMLAEAGIASLQGQEAWGRNGVAVSLTGEIRATIYKGTAFDNNCAVLWPRDEGLLPTIWAFCSSSEFHESVRTIDESLKVMNKTLLKVPFDVDHWRGVAEVEFPDGLPEPWSDDPTQWLFEGDPAVSTDPLQVGVGRLVGFSWPDQEPGGLDRLADSDGIVCLPAVLGERPAADRLRELLVAAFQPDSATELIDSLLADADAEGKGLDWWLRERYFKQHCGLFHNRPFVWHVWDGRKDGFSALVNYHRLDRAMLERLTYSYLGWWIDRQRDQVRGEKAGSEARLGVALDLQGKLELILEGEPPYDVYVRWKELWEQPIGWEPDLNDGVRLNIRPFVEAGVLRSKFNVHWRKDRGKNPDGTERLNNLHYTRADKQAARNEQNS